MYRVLFHRLLPVLLAAMMTAHAAQVGRVSFTPPPGWAAATISGGMKYTHSSAGTVDAVIMVGQDTPVPADPDSWLEARALSFVEGAPQQQQPLQHTTLSGGRKLIAKALVGGTAQEPVFYIVALLTDGQTSVLLALMSSDASKLENYANQLEALADTIKFSGQAAKAVPSSTAPSPANTGATSAGSKLPEVKPLNAAQFIAAGGDPRKQLIPDEYRCYAEIKGQSLTPELVVQVLSGGQYRTVYGGGSVRVESDGGLDKVKFRGGPLDGSDSYLHFDDYGQDFGLNDITEKEVDFQCYQRGARENQALHEFKAMTPKEGKYACTVPDGSGKSGGTLEVLPGNTYRWNASSGKFTVDFRTDQDNGLSHLDFSGGPLDDEFGSYRESEDGGHFLSVGRSTLECRAIAKPVPPVLYGPNKAPAPPAGSGGLSGAYVFTRAGVLMPTINGGLMSECPGNMCWNFLFFKPNGYVFTGEPDHDASEADCTRTHPNGLPICEVYRVQNGKITIGSGKPQTFKKVGPNLEIGGDRYVPLVGMDGLKLDGSFKSQNIMPALVGSGGSISTMYLKFSKQGQFLFDKEFSASFSGSGAAVAINNQQASQGGTYQFVGNTLTLKYADGRVVRLFALPLPDQGRWDYDLLRLGGSTYTRGK